LQSPFIRAMHLRKKTLRRRSLGVLGAVVRVGVLAMFHTRQNLPLRCAIAAEFIRDDDARDTRHPFQQLAEAPQMSRWRAQAARPTATRNACTTPERRRPFRRTMRAAQVLKGPSRLAYAAHACDAPALSARQLDVPRLSEWFLEPARAKTRLTPFTRLMAASLAT
jgi:hypothetical protein